MQTTVKNKRNNKGKSAHNGQNKSADTNQKHDPPKKINRKPRVHRRNQVPSSPEAHLLNQQTAVVVDRAWDGFSAVAAAFGFVCSALPRGLLANVPNPNYPSYAGEYISNVLASAALATTPLAQQVPHWMLSLMRAVAPKTVPFGRGSVAYKWTGQAIAWPVGGVPLNPTGSATSKLVVPTSTSLWGFPAGALPTGYSPAEGERAFATIAQFMQSTFKDRRNKLVSLGEETGWDNNVSTWAVQYGQTGWSAGGGGGIDVLADSEVPIHAPLLSTWNSPDPNPVRTITGRGGQWTMHTSGSPLFIGAALPTIFQEEMWNTKVKPYFKFYDFYEFGQVLAYYAKGLIERLASDNISKATVTNPSDYTCPLSLQEVMLLLRNEIMYVFSSSQATGQGITARRQTSNMFTTFAAGTNTCATAAVNMQLPLAFVENIKSAGSCIGYRKGKSYRAWVPVLGKYDDATLSQSDYQVTFDVQGTETTIPVFTTPVARNVSTKGDQVLVEPIFNLIDGTSSGTPYFINDSERLSELCSLWNEWIANLSAYSSNLTTVTADRGLKVVGVPMKTRHWTVPTQNGTSRHQVFKDDRISKAKGFGTYYSTQQAYAVSSHDPLLPGTDIFYRSFVLPINYIGPAENEHSETDFQRFRGLYEEIATQVLSATGDSSKTLEAIHMTFADQLTRGKGGPLTSMDIEIERLSSLGQAGVLSSLARQLGGAVFGPGVGNILGGIGDAIGI